MASQQPILIIGAGISGLLIAQGLQKAGIPYSIFETDPSNLPKRRDWTLNVHFATSDLKALLPESLFERLREAYCDPYKPVSNGELELTPMFNSSTGEIFHYIPHPDSINVSRRRMRKLCTEGIEVQFEKAFERFELEGDGVRVHFKDGESVVGKMVIGADGAKSSIRSALFVDQPQKAERKPCQVALVTGIVRYQNPEVAKRVRKEAEYYYGYHPKGMFNMFAISDVPDQNDPTTWEFYFANSVLGSPLENQIPELRLKALKERCKDLVEPFRSQIQEISDPESVFNDKLFYWVPLEWDNRVGKVTLVGDAAHPLPPYRGQGLGQSIRDCRNLVDALITLRDEENQTSLKDVISRYEKEMTTRTAAEVEASLQQMYLVHDLEGLMSSPGLKRGNNEANKITEVGNM